MMAPLIHDLEFLQLLFQPGCHPEGLMESFTGANIGEGGKFCGGNSGGDP